MPSRRKFLAASTAGLSGALLGACRTARADLDALPAGRPRGSDYSLDPTIAYLNHGSIGTIPIVVQQARQRYLDTCERNPAHHMWDEPWQELRDAARATLADFVNCRPHELAITHNTTEGFNVLAQGLPLGSGDEVVFSALNHPGASICWEHGGRRRGYRVRRFELTIAEARDLSGDEFIAAHLAAVSDATKLVVLPHIDNLIGCRTPVQRLSRALHERGVEYVAVDGAQAVGMVPVDLTALGVDFYAGSPHKWLQSPKGLGLLYVKATRLAELEPMWVTWGQQRWAGTARIFEDYGTRNLPEVLALADAVRFHRKTSWADRTSHLQALRAHVQERCRDHAKASFASPGDWQLGGSLVGVHVRDARAEDLAARFAQAAIVVRLFPRDDGVVVRVSPNLANDTTDIDRMFATLPA